MISDNIPSRDLAADEDIAGPVLPVAAAHRRAVPGTGLRGGHDRRGRRLPADPAERRRAAGRAAAGARARRSPSTSTTGSSRPARSSGGRRSFVWTSRRLDERTQSQRPTRAPAPSADWPSTSSAGSPRTNPDGQPQSSPVWFLWEDGEILVYSRRRAPRNENIRERPLVSFNLNTDATGDEVVTMEGVARIDPAGPDVSANPALPRQVPGDTSRGTAGRSSGSRPTTPSWCGSRRPAGAWPDAAMTTPVRAARAALLVAAAGAATVTGVRAGGRALVLRAERRLCLTVEPPPYHASERARELHRGLLVADLHADSLLWGRDLLRRVRAGPGGRAAPHRGQRRAPGPRVEHEVAAPPQHRAQRRPQRRHHPDRDRREGGRGPRGGASSPGRCTRPSGPTPWRADPRAGSR